MKAAVALTDRARVRLEHLLEQHQRQNIKLAVNGKGCGGHSYVLDFADPGPHDDCIALNPGSLSVDAKSLLFLLGTEVDWVEDRLGGRFVFSNPVEKGRCGCGASFTV